MKVALTKGEIWMCYLHEQQDLCWGELGSRDTNEKLRVPPEIQCYKARKKQQLSHRLTLMLRVFQWCFYLFLLTALYQGIIGK